MEVVPPAPALSFERVTCTFVDRADARQRYTAIRDVSLAVGAGEFVSLVGPSGCGKSTLLRIVAGLRPATRGTVRVADREVAQPIADIGMVFQAPILLKWRTILDNILLPAELAGKDKRAYWARAHELIEMAELHGFAEKLPRELSGGMQQRASLCRALIHDPSLLMLDEPFASLDMFTREELWLALQDLWLARHPTVILVTHDLREAAFLADRVLVMSGRPGRIIAERQVALPRPRILDVTYEPYSVTLVHDLRAQISAARTSTPGREFAT